MDRVYLYGIIESGDGAIVASTAVEGDSPVYTVTLDALGCVVSDYQGEDIAALPREAILRSLIAHQRVVEGVMQHHVVLPVKFGTLLNRPEEARDLLGQSHGELLDALAAIRGKVEIEVAATWDIGRVLPELSWEAEVIRVKEAISHKGQPSLEEKVKVGQAVKACLDRRRDSYRERMVGYLKPLALDVVANALLSDEMVMNVAFLMERSRQHEFDGAVRHLDDLFQNEIDFRLIGPLPPYSFSTVEVTRLIPRQIEGARQMLGLERAFSVAEVRKAYRRLAAAQQRNLRSGDKLANEQFAKLRPAAELLVRYCQGRNAAPRGGSDDVQDLQDSRGRFAIAIRRTQSNEVEPARFGRM